MKKSDVIPWYAHNAVKYDQHFIVPIMHKVFNSDPFVIAKDEQHYTQIEVAPESRYSEDHQFMNMKVKFLDSLNMNPTSLKNWTKTLTSLPITESQISDNNQRSLMKEKLPCPYSYISLERLDETELPSIEKFYDDLNDKECKPERYELAVRVFNAFHCKTLGDFLDVYLTADILFLADCMYNFRETCMNEYKLDPAWYCTSPGLSRDAFLKLSGVTLELITDPTIYNILERGIRGGVSQVSHSHAKANNKYMRDYDPKKPSIYILYLDANNLYGHSMSQPLPKSNFEFIKSPPDWHSIPDKSEIGYTYIVDLEYPPEIHDYLNDLPLCPVVKCPPKSKTPKLLSTLEKKEQYVIHYRKLKYATSKGVKVTKVHGAVRYKQEDYLRGYIEANTKRRAGTDDKSKKNFYKLLNNSMFGKTMEDVRKRRDIRVVSDPNKLRKLTSHVLYDQTTIVNEELALVHMKKKVITLDKPIYAGQAILDLSKLHMYQFYYDVMKSTYGDKLKLCYMDTDSLIMRIETEDVYEDMREMGDYFDFSNYPVNHPSYETKNKDVVGKFKDEAKGKVITEFIGLRSKLYFISIQDEKKDIKKAKGTKKRVTKTTLSVEDYRKALFEGEKKYEKQMTFGADKHKLSTIHQKRKVIDYSDDKNVIAEDGISRVAYGHKSLAARINS
jgi:hypothetical protein